MENHMDEELILLDSLADRIPLFGRKPIKMPEKITPNWHVNKELLVIVYVYFIP